MPTRSPEPTPAADLAACRAMMRTGSRSFAAAARLLPRRVHEPATALYAFCRLADDLVDLDQAPNPLATLHHRLDQAYAQSPINHPADRAFAAAIARHAIPRALPEALLEGFAWDRAGRRYQTLEALLDYAARVAGSVGAMMTILMGVRTPPALARACDLGVAMQLTNIARDIGEDAKAGRLYLPLDWLEQAGITPAAFLANPQPSPALAGIIARLLATAETLYATGHQGIPALPLTVRPGIRAAALIYADIGRTITHPSHNPITRRAIVPATRKAALLTRALLPTLSPPAPQTPPMPACQYLVEAAAHPEIRKPAPQPKIDWLFDLFERLQQRQLGVS